MTTAQRVSAMFEDDGMVWETKDGKTVEEVCESLCSYTEHRDEGEGVCSATRYVFPDESAIVITEDAWDIEGSTSFSWAGNE